MCRPRFSGAGISCWERAWNWPIFVLTLPGDGLRRSPLISELDRLELPYQLFFGIDGRAGLAPEHAALTDPAIAQARLGRPMTNGEMACALSHRSIYQHIIDNELPGAIVLEDDAQLQPGFAEFIRSLDYQHVPMVLMDFAFGRAIPVLRKKVTSGELRRAAVQATVTTAYTLSADAATKLFAACTPVSHPSDWPCELYDLGAWLMVPRLVMHDAPGQRVSHLDRERARKCADGDKTARKRDLMQRLRRRLSIRVGRAKGQR